MIEQYFMDYTYKTVPPSIYKFKLMVISGHEYSKNKTLLCAFILLMNETKFAFDEILNSPIKLINEIFPRCNIHGCFFHFSQGLWNHFRKYGLCGKNTYLNNSELLFNLQILCFIPLEEVEDFYNKKKKNLKIININNSLPILIVHG